MGKTPREKAQEKLWAKHDKEQYELNVRHYEEQIALERRFSNLTMMKYYEQKLEELKKRGYSAY
jgi:hypothetical protein